MRNYEVTFVVDPVLSGDEIKSTAKIYVDMITDSGANIIQNDEMGLRQLAYPINTRSSGVYTCVEFECEKVDWILKLELAFRRDERILRFLTVKLDKYGVKYNQDKRDGLIGKAKKIEKKENTDSRGRDRDRGRRDNRPPRSNAPKKEAPQAPKDAKPVAAAPVDKNTADSK